MAPELCKTTPNRVTAWGPSTVNEGQKIKVGSLRRRIKITAQPPASPYSSLCVVKALSTERRSPSGGFQPSCMAETRLSARRLF